MMASPQFPPSQGFQGFPGQPTINPQPKWQGNPSPAQPRMPPPAALAVASGNPNALPPPKVRMQAPEAPTAAARLALPSPEELGLAEATPSEPSQGGSVSAFDWNLAHTRLQHLGAVGFHIDRLAPGRFRVTFFLPTAQARQTHHVEAEATSEAAAAQSALDQAEAWARMRK